MKAFPTLVLGIALLGAGAAGWWIRGNVYFHDGAPGPGAARRIRFYQSPMHPWIKSDQPGLCTICGMKLVPVYEGDEELQSPSVVTLGSNTPSIAGIATTAVGRRPIVRSMRVAGTIDDDDSRHRILPAYVEGRIEELHVHHVGAEVTAGQPLATFYSPA
ncbi:MAG: efflux RND transporter periplasmic adaptor subunit, partial [Verrucomicrobia bacterium]